MMTTWNQSSATEFIARSRSAWENGVRVLHSLGGASIEIRGPRAEMDRMAPVDPAATLTLDAQLLAEFPEGYRHLAYLQTRIGFQVKKNLPGTRGPEIEELMSRGVRWLAGEDAVCLG